MITLTILFLVAVCVLAWRMFVFALKAAWGILSIIAAVLLLPLFIVFLFFAGFALIAVPLLLIAGIIAIVGYTKQNG